MTKNFDLLVIGTLSGFYDGFLHLREEILRKPIGLILSKEDTQDDHQQYIFIAVIEKEVIGCLMAKGYGGDVVKFRQMAISPLLQKTGVGSALLAFAEAHCREEHFIQCVLNARVEAIPFYVKNGYAITGEEFMEVGIPHKKMYKYLHPVIH